MPETLTEPCVPVNVDLIKTSDPVNVGAATSTPVTTVLDTVPTAACVVGEARTRLNVSFVTPPILIALSIPVTAVAIAVVSTPATVSVEGVTVGFDTVPDGV